MKLLYKPILLFLIFIPVLAWSQVRVVSFSYIDSIIHNNNDTTYVINFWATWCKPCVHELPAFDALNTTGKKMKVIMVCLDFKNELNSKVIPFVQKRLKNPEVVLLDEPDYNSWIDKVDSSWTGGIPATLIINTAERRHEFFEKEFTSEELNKLLNL